MQGASPGEVLVEAAPVEPEGQVKEDLLARCTIELHTRVIAQTPHAIIVAGRQKLEPEHEDYVGDGEEYPANPHARCEVGTMDDECDRTGEHHKGGRMDRIPKQQTK